jgi:hypothetical protein
VLRLQRINRGLGGGTVRTIIEEQLLDLTLDAVTYPPILNVDVEFRNIDARPLGAAEGVNGR